MVIRPRSALRAPTSSCSSESQSARIRCAQASTRSPSWRQALEPVAALDHEHAQILLEMPQARRKRRLRHAARLGGAREMPLAGEGHEVAELADVHDGPLLPCGGRAPYFTYR